MHAASHTQSSAQSPIKRPVHHVCVIGAGIMGSALAAHLAGCGIRCLLLDVAEKGDSKTQRNQRAQQGLQRTLQTKPPAFFDPHDAKTIEIGNLEDDLHRIKQCDWVLEAVVEDLQVKKNLFAQLQQHLSDTCIVSSNTSGLTTKQLLADLPESFAKRFVITHFFNPVRYLPLVEIVPAEKTDSEIIKRMQFVLSHQLGKHVVQAKDTPNFIGNRIGLFTLLCTWKLMQEGDYSVAEIDAIFGPAMGRPRSAVCRTADLVGLDTLAHVANMCQTQLPEPQFPHAFDLPEFMTQLIAKGHLGQKSGQGFYRKTPEGILALNIKDLSYETQQKRAFESLNQIKGKPLQQRLHLLLHHDDAAALLARKVTAHTCAYAAWHLESIADNLTQIDNAMQDGFGWRLGPFALWDAVGVAWLVDVMKQENIPVASWVHSMLQSGRETFYNTHQGQRTFWDSMNKQAQPLQQDAKQLSIDDMMHHSPKAVVHKDDSASLIDMGEKILAVQLHSKLNVIDSTTLQVIERGLDQCENGAFDALVLTGKGDHFCAGANLLLLGLAMQSGEYKQIEQLIHAFQRVALRLQYSPFPTVSAPFGMTLGGGTELALACNSTQAHAELYMGLVEAGVGLVPAGGGNVVALRAALANAPDDPHFAPDALLRPVLERIAMAKVTSSAQEGKRWRWLKQSDGITLNRHHVLHAAKQRALGMVQQGFTSPKPRVFRLPGPSCAASFAAAIRALRDGKFISAHDEIIALHVAKILTGGNCSTKQPVSEQHILDLEREAFLHLCGQEKTQQRIAHTLQTGKPLRN
ncbi:MAG: 3-hydroxyacyl-CoA dehydrogenase NAD-binding domain-containing protein [Myxococcota bacterium]